MSEPPPPDLPDQLNLDEDQTAREAYALPRLLVLIVTLVVLAALFGVPIVIGVLGD